jgi:hypothetical protein
MRGPFVSELRRELVGAAERRERRRLRLPALRLGRRQLLVAAAAACAAIAIAVVALPGSGQRSSVPATSGSETPLFGGSLDPDVRYATRVQEPALSFQVDDGEWFVRDAAEPSFLDIERRAPRDETGQEGPPVGFLWFLRPTQVYDPAARGSLDSALTDMPDDFLAWLRRHPDVRAGRPEPVTVAGMDGTQVDLAVSFTRPAVADPWCRQTFQLPCTAIAPFVESLDGERMRIMVFEVDGAPFVIGITAFDARGLDALLPHAEAVLETLRVR